MRKVAQVMFLSGAVICLIFLSGCVATGLGKRSSYSLPRHGYKVGKPYTVRGVTYTPRVDYKYDEIGIASWYAEGFHGRRTASGEIYNSNDLTAAHPTLPMPTVVKVTRLDNGRSVVVRINDRGPFVPGRIIDLSKRAAEELDMLRVGVARVRVQVLEAETKRLLARMGMAVESPDASSRTASSVLAAPAAVTEAVSVRQSVVGDRSSTPTSAQRTVSLNSPNFPEEAGVLADVATKNRMSATPILWIVQIGSFSSRQTAQQVLEQTRINTASRIEEVDIGGKTFYRAQLGPYADRKQAEQVYQQILAAGFTGARIFSVH